MRDFKLDALAKIDRLAINSLASVNTSAIADAVTAFISNTNRACCLAVFPVELSSVSIHAMGMLGGLLIKGSLENQQGKSFDLIRDIKSLLENMQSFSEKQGSSVDALARSIWENPAYAELLRKLVANKAVPQLANDVKEFEVGIDAFLAAVIVNGWTAFETLAGDLWVQSVNAQPRYIAALTGTGNRIKSIMAARGKTKTTDEASENEIKDDLEDNNLYEKSGDKSIPLGLMCKITSSDYNFSKSMGNLLVEAERVKFTSLREIRKAYSLAFPDNVRRAKSARIDTALANRGLDALSAVRNLIVHKAGKCDSDYIEDCKSSPTAPRLKEGETLQLDGELCQALIDRAINVGIELVNAVDSWLTATRC
jgi:hypothetical protein